jgi:hypothetical protein
MSIHFDSAREYLSFSGAYDFYDRAHHCSYHYPKNLLEQMGEGIIYPISKSVNGTLKNIRKPSVILALTLSAIALVTFAFYPSVFSKSFTLSHLKFPIFLTLEFNILGLGMRTLGRLGNPTLSQSWMRREIIPIPIGTVIH